VQTKYIVIFGSLLSGLGKGGITSSLLKILDFYDYRAVPVKFDGYLNYDCGTMNPYRHGEVFVLDDKSEVDMDFGMYERFSGINMKGIQSITGGKLFSKVIAKERRGDYLGEDVQIIPHLTNEIISNIEGIAEAEGPDVVVVEVGGTVGDIENSYFIEAMRQLSLRNEVVFINLTYIPKIDVVGEQKTKPAQIGLRLLMQLGIMPNFIICRTSTPLLEKTKEKIALHSSTKKERIVDDSDMGSVYELPLHFISQGFDRMLMADLKFDGRPINKEKVQKWKSLVDRIRSADKEVSIAIVGKYMDLKDSYVSVREALVHSAAANNANLKINWVESEELEDGSVKRRLADADGVLVPGGFGERGIEGMIAAIKFARENGVPYLGLCLGMQLMVIEYARNVCGMDGANSSEFSDDSAYKVIDIMDSQKWIDAKGGTMRLGAWDAAIREGTMAHAAYGRLSASERHRHRYEFNSTYREILEEKGLVVSGTTAGGNVVEIVEWKSHFGIGTQAHPELKSRLESPAPLFMAFVRAALGSRQEKH
jgi:CTP synthase